MIDFKRVYFIGIGGIGMSSLARYFVSNGYCVSGYDRTSTPLTRALESEGVAVNYNQKVENIPAQFLDSASTLVVFTPAVPSDMAQLLYFREHGFEVVKRSEILGVVTHSKYTMAVSGTHGKTSTTTMLAWLNARAADDNDGVIGSGSAFMGGISKNFGSNLHIGSGPRVAVEADEFDRSFLRLFPDVALVTATDADHLDIYGSHEALKQSFADFVAQIKDGGTLIKHIRAEVENFNPQVACYTYSMDNQRASFYAKNIVCNSCGLYTFDVVCPNGRIIDALKLGIPGHVNVENAVGAVAMMWVAGFNEEALRDGLATFSGVSRRFDVRYVSPSKIYIDDYAHHPEELRKTIESVREMYPNKKITAVFQPHLYTRTRDFSDGFASSLSLVDRVVLLPIYPARERPIEGVESELILNKITIPEKEIVEKTELLNRLKSDTNQILITFGAGDIDAFVAPITEMLGQ